jgi:hypothetical protein
VAEGGVIGESVTTVAFRAEFDTSESEVFGGAVCLAVFDGHCGGVCLGGAGESASEDGVICAAYVSPRRRSCFRYC